jgi:hypothetical protein
MPQRCATIDELLVLAPEFLTAGSQSTGTLTFASNPAPGDAVTLSTQYDVPIVAETYVAGTDFTIGVDETETATNFVTGLASSALVTATSSGPVVSVLSLNTGPVSVLETTSTAASMVWTDPTLMGGDALVNEVLECTCCMINTEAWGQKASCGHTYLAAHFLATAGYGSGEQGVVSGKSIDKLSLSFSTPTPTDSEFATTRWGRMYVAMQSTLFTLGLSGNCRAKNFICVF